MRFTRRNKEFLSRLGGVGNRMFLSPPNKFTIFGEGKKLTDVRDGHTLYEDDGLVVQGRLPNDIQNEVGFSNFAKSRSSFSKKGCKTKPNYLKGNDLAKLKNDVERLYELFDTGLICNFSITSKTLKNQKAWFRNLKSSHLRFVKTPDCPPVYRVFDATTHFDEVHYTKGDIGTYGEGEIVNYDGRPFSLTVKANTYKRLIPSDYEVTIYENGMGVFTCMSENLIYLMRDQKIGEQFSVSFNERLGEDVLFSFHPK